MCDGYTNANYSTGIYSDWYLPAIDQLSLIYNARYILNKNIESVSGANIFGKEIYWSSTEDYGYYVWYLGFGYSAPYTYIGDKGTPNYVRTVRAF